ncbi:MAG TPA: tetratricopeptide repeat protein, partial [Vulgatibacter sp.]
AGTPPRLVAGPRFLGARAIASALEPEVGILAAYVAAGSTHHSDREGAKAILEDALRAVPGSPPLLQLRAEIGRADDGLPKAIGQARAASDLEAVLAKDPSNPRARWSAAAILRDAGRHEEAEGKLTAAEGESTGSATLALARARIALARGFDVQAWQHARDAVERDPGSCHAGTILFDLARRADAAGEMEDAAQRFAGCPGGRARLAGLLASRGHDDEALRLYRELLAEDPQDPAAALRLSERLLAAGDAAGAARLVLGLEELWPRSSFLPRRRAQLLERAGDLDGAGRARERALALDGSDLALRRMDAFRAGKDLLAQYDRDGLEVIREFEGRRRSFDTATVTVFDFAAVEAFEDGSFVERVHVISKVLDKRGVDVLGEAHVPSGAEVIHLRTIKKDGSILEPESIGGKESVSLPNLDVGDYVEMEWLLATPARGVGMPGWSASPFYFRTAGTPLVESVYVARAPKGMSLDLHNGAPAPEVLEDGDHVTLRVVSRDNPAFVAEPAGVRGEEFLPWVQAGAGADELSLGWLYADGLAQATERTSEVAAWARAIAARVPGAGRNRAALVRAIYDQAMEDVEGSDSSVGSSASRVLAQKRGNRALLVKAALDELGIPSRWAVVKTYDQSPAAFRFPRASRWSYLALVVRPDPEGGQLWLDPTVRWAPFGRLSPAAEGSPAMLLPETGTESPQEVGTPGGSDLPRGRVVEVRLTLREDGTLVGEGSERYLAFDAAWARGSLEKLDEDSRKQAVESALAKGFRGLTLDELAIDPPDGESLVLRYRFTVPTATHDLGQGMRSLDLDFFAANLGRRYLTRGDRETALFLRAPEKVETRIDLELPPSVRVVGAPDAARETGRFGDYKRSVAASPGRLAIEESLEVARGRVRPHEYREFARWVLSVDRAQAADLVLAGPPARVEQAGVGAQQAARVDQAGLGVR